MWLEWECEKSRLWWLYQFCAFQFKAKLMRRGMNSTRIAFELGDGRQCDIIKINWSCRVSDIHACGIWSEYQAITELSPTHLHNRLTLLLTSCSESHKLSWGFTFFFFFFPSNVFNVSVCWSFSIKEWLWILFECILCGNLFKIPKEFPDKKIQFYLTFDWRLSDILRVFVLKNLANKIATTSEDADKMYFENVASIFIVRCCMHERWRTIAISCKNRDLKENAKIFMEEGIGAHYNGNIKSWISTHTSRMPFCCEMA